MVDHRSIGVLDSGVGGLTVAKELRNLLPQESIIYFGDNINVPYGNKTEEEIAELTKKMIDFLIEKEVKLIAIACNTISTILDKYFSHYNLPIVSIIKSTADYVVKNELNKVGVIATEFTVKTGAYDHLIHEKDPSVEIVSEGSPDLAKLIDRGDFTDLEVEALVNLHMSNILSKGNPKDIILGCTHYPIVMDQFKKRCPEINFINPAYEQVVYIGKLLEGKDMEGNHNPSTFEIYTTGSKETYGKMIDLLSMKKPDHIFNL